MSIKKSKAGRLVWLPLACLVFAVGNAGAEQKLFSLEIPDAQVAHFEVPFEVEHPGEISVQATWSGNRPLAFRIEPPGRDGVATRRSGTSPVHLKMDVRPNQLKQGSWTLIIHALPLSGAGEGRLTLDLPGPPVVEKAQATQPEPQFEDWQKPRVSPEGLGKEQRHLVRSTESFRKLLVDASYRPPDTCRWQDDLLRWLAAQRDQALDESFKPDPATGKLMARMAEVIRTVDDVRQSTDPVLIGPPPNDRAKRTRWERLRSTQLRPVERSLDELMNAVQREHAPGLKGEQWPLRMVSCLTATERYFEQRWVDGADRTPNRELAEAQWRPLNRAGTALDALSRLAPEDVIRLRSRNE